MSSLFSLPPTFWLSLAIIAIAIAYCWGQRRFAWGVPGMAVCGTVLLWYHGDALYNDYEARHLVLFDTMTLDFAWLEVSMFTVVFVLAAKFFHFGFNKLYVHRKSTVNDLLTSNQAVGRVQPFLFTAFQATGFAWCAITAFGLLRTNLAVLPYFFPYIAGYRASPWGRGRLGGAFDAVLSLLGYVELFCLACFGVVAALTYSRQHRSLAILLIFLSWPSYVLDRNRNLMLAIALPAVLAFIFLRLRSNRIAQIVVLLLSFLAIDGWFRFVLANRTDTSVVQALQAQERRVSAKHEGLNMFEELAWANKLTTEGNYRPNWGYRYFAELCNPIPRALWPEKPMVGIDYAVARGYGGGTEGTGVTTTIATGMIGQGVVNFGPFFGPIAAALIMALWTTVLARFDLTPEKAGRMLLYVVGIVLTFNMGRDITLLVTYPLVFGYIIFNVYESHISRHVESLGIARRQQVKQ